MMLYAGGSEIRVERSPAQRVHGTARGKHKIAFLRQNNVSKSAVSMPGFIEKSKEGI